MRTEDEWRMLALVGALAIVSAVPASRRHPNIIFILVDDAGLGDFQSIDPHMATPNIEKLRQQGIYLNQSYVSPMCTPTRAALLSGRHPHTVGMQDIIPNSKPVWLNENLTLLPEEMKKLNYKTHMLGKWHLSFCHSGLTPLGRGFDTFYGFWPGSVDSYFNHTKRPFDTYTWRDEDKPDWTAKGHYQTDLLNDRAVEIVNASKTDRFFMYLAYGAPHGPFEVPQHYINRYCPHVTNSTRAIHCGMMAAVDEGIGRIMAVLKDRDLDDKTAILFMSDNGGPVKDGSSNWPLRGSKKSIYEGGIRSYTILKEPRLVKTNITWPGLVMHVDWYPTLVSIAGGRVNITAQGLHGYNLWTQMRKNVRRSPRKYVIIVNDYERNNHTVIRFNKWKLLGILPSLINTSSKWMTGLSPGWYPPYQLLGHNGTEMEEDVPMQKFNDTYYELYDLEKDPQERENLAGKKKRRLNKMKEELNKRLEQFKLQPWNHNPGKFRKNRENGVYIRCWCDPPGLANEICIK